MKIFTSLAHSLGLFTATDLRCVFESAIKENDREWCQIFESVLDYHPISQTDALKSGIRIMKKIKSEKG